MRQRNIGAPAHVSRKKIGAKIDNLQPIIREEKSSVDFLERQRFAEKNVIHSTRRIDVDLKPRSFLPSKLINAVRGDARWLMKFVGRDIFRQIRVEPVRGFDWPDCCFDVRNAHFMFGEVVNEISGANAFVACDLEILKNNCGLREMYFGGRAVHPLSAKPGPIQRNTSVALPAFRMSINQVRSPSHENSARHSESGKFLNATLATAACPITFICGRSPEKFAEPETSIIGAALNVASASALPASAASSNPLMSRLLRARKFPALVRRLQFAVATNPPRRSLHSHCERVSVWSLHSAAAIKLRAS